MWLVEFSISWAFNRSCLNALVHSLWGVAFQRCSYQKRCNQSHQQTCIYCQNNEAGIHKSHISTQTQTPVWNTVAACRLNITPKISRVACGRRPSDSWNKTEWRQRNSFWYPGSRCIRKCKNQSIISNTQSLTLKETNFFCRRNIKVQMHMNQTYS